MGTCSTAEITKLLKAWGSGDRAVLEGSGADSEGDWR